MAEATQAGLMPKRVSSPWCRVGFGFVGWYSTSFVVVVVVGGGGGGTRCNRILH
jgi:hypothetical protein